MRSILSSSPLSSSVSRRSADDDESDHANVTCVNTCRPGESRSGGELAIMRLTNSERFTRGFEERRNRIVGLTRATTDARHRREQLCERVAAAEARCNAVQIERCELVVKTAAPATFRRLVAAECKSDGINLAASALRAVTVELAADGESVIGRADAVVSVALTELLAVTAVSSASWYEHSRQDADNDAQRTVDRIRADAADAARRIERRRSESEQVRARRRHCASRLRSLQNEIAVLSSRNAAAEDELTNSAVDVVESRAAYEQVDREVRGLVQQNGDNARRLNDVDAIMKSSAENDWDAPRVGASASRRSSRTNKKQRT